MRRGDAGVTRLNEALQQALNAQGQAVLKRAFRVGDKVMQTRNNYELDVFNGDVGVVTLVDEETNEVHVQYEDAVVLYSLAELDDLALAYAATVHKVSRKRVPRRGHHAASPALPVTPAERALYGGHARGEDCRYRGDKKAIRMPSRTVRWPNGTRVSRRGSGTRYSDRQQLDAAPWVLSRARSALSTFGGRYRRAAREARGIFVHQHHRAMLRLDERLAMDVVEEIEHCRIEPARVEESAGFLVEAELRPCEGLEELLDRSQAPGQSNERVGEVAHEGLTLVHGIHDAQVEQSRKGKFALEQMSGDDADHFAACVQNGSRDFAHQAHAAAAVDQGNLSVRQLPAHFPAALTYAGLEPGLDPQKTHIRRMDDTGSSPLCRNDQWNT
jgi:hypothetical protein